MAISQNLAFALAILVGAICVWYLYNALTAPSTFVVISDSVGCDGDGCDIRNKAQPIPHIYNGAASWYVYGPTSPPIVAWVRQQMVVANNDAIDNYLSATINGDQAPWGPNSSLMRNRRG